MATTQLGTGSLVIEGGAAGSLETKAALFVTVPSGAIIEAVNVEPGGTPSKSTQETSTGAFHTRLIHENRQDTFSLTMVGREYTKAAGVLDGSGSAYEIEKVAAKFGKAAVKTEISGVKDVL